MKKVKFFALMLLVSMFAVSCGSDSKDDNDDSNPTNGGSTGGVSSISGTLTTHQGSNTVVTEANVEEVSAEVTAKAFSVFGRALEEAAPKSPKPSVGQIINLDGQVQGETSGYATVKGKYTINMAGMTVDNTTYDFTCTFYDFADDNDLFLGGGLKYTGKLDDMENYNNMKYNITIKGGLKFNGKWDGTQDFTTVYTMLGQNMSWTSTTTTKSGGNTFTKTMNYPQ